MTAILDSVDRENDAARPLGVGIIGLGLAGGIMVSVIHQHPGMQLVGAAEPDAGTRERFEKEEGVPAFATAEELVARDDINIVYVATPHQFHREHAILAAASGKHVIVEKPMALSLADCSAMIAAARDNNVHLVVGHTHSFDPAVLAMREMIASGNVGKLISIATWNYTDFLYRPRRPEELDTAAGGGIIFNQIPHQLDIIRLLAGSRVRSIRAATTQLDPSRPTEGSCSAFLDFDSGASATLVYSGYDRFDSDELHGWVSEGGYDKTAAHGKSRSALALVADREEEAGKRRTAFGYGAAISSSQPPHQPHFGLLLVSCERADIRQSADGLWIYDDEGAREIAIPRQGWRPGRGDVLEEMRRAIVDGVHPLHDGNFGRGTVACSLALLASARERREIIMDMEAG